MMQVLLSLCVLAAVDAYLGSGRGWIRPYPSKSLLSAGKFSTDNRSPRNKPVNKNAPHQLTRSEIKAKAIQKAMQPPFVERCYEGIRFNVENVTVGARYDGQIITVKEFGLYVDIGANRDGLVHIKDVSRDYFTQNLPSKFSAGEKVSVWVKFVDKTINKFGLQMFPLSENRASGSIPKVDIEKLSVGDALMGTVVRVSEFGVYVDVDAESDAYLHKRKMKLTRKQMPLKPWEVLPIGYKVNVYVHELDVLRRRIGLTTFHPDAWEDSIPTKDDVEDMVEDDEELGGSSRADNIRALERTLALDIDEEDDEDEGEEMTADEIAAALTDSSRKARIFLDDTPMGSADETPMKTSPKMLEADAEDISVDELFEELANGRSYITVSDIMRWDYLAEVIAEGDIDKETVKELFLEAGADAGKIYPDQLDTFIDLLAEELGLEEAGDYNDDDDDEEEEEEEDEEEEDDVHMALMMDDTEEGAEDDSKHYLMEDEEEASEFQDGLSSSADTAEEEELLEQIGAGSTKELSLADHYEKKSKNNDLLTYVFNSVAKGKKAATFEDVCAWEFVRALLLQRTIDEKQLQALFSKCAPKTGALDMKSFERLVDLLGETGEKAASKSVASPVAVIASAPKNVLPLIPSSSANVMLNIEDLEDDVDSFDEEDDADLEEEMSLIFNKKKSISFRELVKAELIEQLIEDGIIDVDDLKTVFEQAGAKLSKPTSKGKTTATDLVLVQKDFDAFVMGLRGFIDMYFEASDEAAAADSAEEDVQMSDVAMQSAVTNNMHTASSGSGNTDALSDDDEDEEEEEEEEEELIEDVFKGVGGGKSRVTLKDMLNWDLCEDLMSNSLLTEESLDALMKECGADRKGVDIAGFDALVNRLVDLYDAMDDTLEEAADADADDEDDDDEDEDEDEEYYDIDVDEVFEEIAKGKDHLTIEDLRGWDLLQQMTEVGLMNEAEFQDVLESAGLQGVTVFSREAFESFVEEIEERTTDHDSEDDADA